MKRIREAAPTEKKGQLGAPSTSTPVLLSKFYQGEGASTGSTRDEERMKFRREKVVVDESKGTQEGGVMALQKRKNSFLHHAPLRLG